jgi:hypothetical protein
LTFRDLKKCEKILNNYQEKKNRHLSDWQTMEVTQLKIIFNPKFFFSIEQLVGFWYLPFWKLVPSPQIETSS